MLSVVAGGVALFVLYRQMDDEIRRRIETRVAQHYPGLKVSIRSAQLVEGKGIRVRDLSIAEPGVEGAGAELLHVEEMLLDCPTDWRQLLEGNPPVRRVTFRRPVIRATLRSDNTWSTSRLLPLPNFSNRPPEITWENGVVEIVDSQKTPSSAFVLRDINLTIVPVPAEEGAADSAALSAASSPAASSPVALSPAAVKSDVRQLRGTLGGDGFRGVEFEGCFDARKSAWSIHGRAAGVEVSPELRDSLPGPLSSKLSAWRELRGRTDMEFSLGYDPALLQPFRFDVSGRVTHGRIDDPRLPQPLTDIQSEFHLDNGGYAINDLTARSGQTTLRMSCRRSGYETTSPLTLSAEIRRLELDPALLGILPEVLQDQWYKYRPAGQIDADVQLTGDGRTWRPDVTVRCLNVSFTHSKFPYRLDHGRGTLELKNDSLKVNLTAYGGSRPVRLSAEVSIRLPARRAGSRPRATTFRSMRRCFRPCPRNRRRWPVRSIRAER